MRPKKNYEDEAKSDKKTKLRERERRPKFKRFQPI